MFKASDGQEIRVYSWLHPSPKAVVHIAHGIAEHGARYGFLAEALWKAGYSVYAHDHRGHGETPGEQGHWNPDGFRRVVQDLEELLAAEAQGREMILFGHSMGSIIVQALAGKTKLPLRGLILSGPPARPNFTKRLALRGLLVALKAMMGPAAKPSITQDLTTKTYNAKFSPNRTECDWLTRDQAEVDKYVADPKCNFTCDLSFWLSFATQGVFPIHWKGKPTVQSILIYAGEQDPVTEGGVSISQIRAAVKSVAGPSPKVTVYPDARHEMHNEISKHEVVQDIINFIEQILPGAQPLSRM